MRASFGAILSNGRLVSQVGILAELCHKCHRMKTVCDAFCDGYSPLIPRDSWKVSRLSQNSEV